MTDAFKLIIEDEEGKRNIVPLSLGEANIGRHQSSTIRLNQRNVSRNHLRLLRDPRDGVVYAEDMDSYNGVYLNGVRIENREELYDGDLLKVGDFHLELKGELLGRNLEHTTKKTLRPELDETRPNITPIDFGGGSNGSEPTLTLTPAISENVSSEIEATAIIRMEHMAGASGGASAQVDVSESAGKLLCVNTSYAGTEFKLTQKAVVIGRTQDNDVVIDHRSVSRHHARLVMGDGYQIEDMGSANGVLVNGESYARIDLKHGDLIELGHVKFRYVSAGGVYTVTDEERSEIKFHAARTAKKGERRLLQKPMLIGMAALAVAVTVVFFAGRANTVERVDTKIPTLDEPRMTDNARLLQKVQEFMEARQWAKAQTLLRVAIQSEPEDVKALDLLEMVDAELVHRDNFDKANNFIEEERWTDAWNTLSEISRDSAYYADVLGLREQVREHLITRVLAEIDKSLEKGDTELMAGHLDELRVLDPAHPQVELVERSLNEFLKAGEKEEDKPAPRKPRQINRRPGVGSGRQSVTAGDIFEPAVEPKGPTAQDLYRKGTSELNAGNVQRAVQVLGQCLKKDPKYCLCFRSLGIAQAKQRKGADAARSYRSYLNLCPDAPDGAQVRAMLKQFGG
jgi:ABC transport system ATP-binding/permease protein